MSDIHELTRLSIKVVKKLRVRKEELKTELADKEMQIKTIEKMLGTLTPEDPKPAMTEEG